MPRARSSVTVLLALLLALAGAPRPRAQSAPSSGPAIRLIVLVVVDQFRQDYLWRFREGYIGGLQRLVSRGAFFTNAFLEHYPTVTAVGHATVLTGASPSVSGIIGNDWYNRTAGKSVQSITDDTVTLVGATGPGASPQRLLVTTLGDELKLAASGVTDPERIPRAIGVSAKDRSAILPLGRGADAAYWLPAEGGPFASSTFYFPALPAWVTAFNQKAKISRRSGGGVDTNARVLTFAREALAAERLGQRRTTDILSIGLSDNDTIGHAHGPDSPEVREISIDTDRQLGEFFDALDRRVGLARTLVVLTADHGVASVPETMTARRLPGGRMAASDLQNPIRATLNTRFGAGEWIVGTAGSSIYLNHQLVVERKLDAEQVRRVAAEAAMAVPHVARVYTRDQLLRGQVAPDLAGRRVLRGFHPQRSGDLEILLDPHWIRGTIVTTHGTPYNYDTHIPLIFMGPGITAGRYHQRVSLGDVAPTLAAMLDINLPSGADGRVLEEMLSRAGTPGPPRTGATRQQ